jgi:hypothetical protein
MARQKQAVWKPATFAAVVFHSPVQQQVSPVVAHLWKQPVVDLLLKSEESFTTNDVNLVCARFIGWCYSQAEVDTFELGVYNAPSPAGRADPEDPDTWYPGVMAALSRCDPPPVLMNLDILEITCGGQVLWRAGAPEYPYPRVHAILGERCTSRNDDSEPSSGDARPTASNPPDSPPSKRTKGKARKRPPRP